MKKERVRQTAGVDVGSTTTAESTRRIAVTATEAQNEFGRMLDTVAGDRVVVITKHNTPRAVLMSIDRYDALCGVEEAVLDTLTDEFDALLERMQTPAARTGMKRAFGASTAELGQAAVTAAKRRSGG